MNFVLMFLSIIGILFVLYVFNIKKVKENKDTFENKPTTSIIQPKIYKSNRSKCFSCEKQDPDSFHTPCFSCNKNIKYPDENNMPGRYLQR